HSLAHSSGSLYKPRADASRFLRRNVRSARCLHRFTHNSQMEVERIELSSGSPQLKNLHTYLLPFDSPAVTVEATKHHGTLAQIGLTLRPPEHGSDRGSLLKLRFFPAHRRCRGKRG